MSTEKIKRKFAKEMAEELVVYLKEGKKRIPS